MWVHSMKGVGADQGHGHETNAYPMSACFSVIGFYCFFFRALVNHQFTCQPQIKHKPIL